MRKTGKIIKCAVCGKNRFSSPSRLKIRNFCSRKCADFYRIGKKLPINIIEKMKGRISNKNPAWRGGRTITIAGYIWIYKPEHPSSHNAYVWEHRLVMEKHLGRYLKSTEHIHHINGNKSDNRIKNLIVLSNSKHIKLYHHK